ncbi:unnamed protein product [Sphagnum balticum]
MSSKSSGGVIHALFSLVYFILNLIFRFTVNFGVFIALGACLYQAGQFSKASIEKQKQVLDLIYWRDLKKSGIAFGITLFVLICLSTMSIVSVIAYTGLALLAATASVRVATIVTEKMGKDVEAVKIAQNFVNGTSTHIPAERVHQQMDILVEHGNHLLDTLRKLLLIDDMVETVKVR